MVEFLKHSEVEAEATYPCKAAAAYVTSTAICYNRNCIHVKECISYKLMSTVESTKKSNSIATF
jgi:hypothetical protein